MKIFLTFFVFALAFVSCKNDEEKIELISEIDGHEYKADMEGEMSARKAARMWLEGKTEDLYVSETVIYDLADSVVTSDTNWRETYFQTLNFFIADIDSAALEYCGTSIFTYFVHFPQEYLEQLESMDFEQRNYWNTALAGELRNLLQTQENASTDKVTSLAYQYCPDCNEEEKELILGYLTMLDSFVE